MEIKDKTLLITLSFLGKLFNLILNSKKTLKFLLIKISGELEIEELEELKEKYLLLNKNIDIHNIYFETDKLENIFLKEINSTNSNQVEIRLKLEEKFKNKNDKIPLKTEELKVFAIELKENLEFLENENKIFSHQDLENNFKLKIDNNIKILTHEIIKKKEIALEAKNYSFMLIDKIKNLLKDDFSNLDDSNIEKYKLDLERFSFLDSKKYNLFLNNFEIKLIEILDLIKNLSDDLNFARNVKFTNLKPEFPEEIKILNNEDLLNHINENSKNGICIKKYLEKNTKKSLDIEKFKYDFSYYYKYSISNIKKIYLEYFDFSNRNQKILLEEILLKILEHNDYKIPELYINFYYGNLPNFISKINSIDILSLTENSHKLNGLEYLLPFNKIKTIYVDPSVAKEKSLISKLIDEKCNFDRKLNIFSNSEYIDYSIFSSLEKITINFSSKIACMFNVSLSGTNLIELFIEDLNEDYKINYIEKNKLDFFINKTKNKSSSRNNMTNSTNLITMKTSLINSNKINTLHENLNKIKNSEINLKSQTCRISSNSSPMNCQFDILEQNINLHEKNNSFSVLKFLKFTNCLINSKFKMSHCNNLKELFFDNCLFDKAPFEIFSSIQKLYLKLCFQKINMKELNFIWENYKKLNHLVIHEPTEEFFQIILRSNILTSLKSLEIYKIFIENFDELFKMILNKNNFEKVIIFPNYSKTDNLLLIRFLETSLKYNSHIENLEFLVGLKFNYANIDRVKYFLRKSKNIKNIKFYMPKEEEILWLNQFKDFKTVNWSIENTIFEQEISDYYVDKNI